MINENIKKNLLPAAIVIAGLLIAGVLYIKNGAEKGLEGVLPPQQAVEKAINYINKNLLPEGVQATLGNVTEENGLYKFKLTISGQEYDSFVTKNGKLLFTEQGIDLDKKSETIEQKSSTIGNFFVSQDEICKENDKPIVYFFGSESCPHCLWQHPIIEKVADSFKDYVSFHDNVDTDRDAEVFSRYSTGGVPTLVLGCKYYRVGSGQKAGEEEESRILTALLCKLTGEKPGEICEPVKDLISQINE